MKNTTFLIILLTILISATAFLQPECSPADFIKLKDKKLQDDFFAQLDSIKKIQYPNNDQNINNSVDLNRNLLEQFLKDINIESFKKTGNYENHYFFNIAPPQYKDSRECKDKIAIQYFEDSFSFRIIVDNVYMVGQDCIGGSQVSYSFKIKENRIVNFNRNEAG